MAKDMNEYKIVVSGTTGAGKTTAIHAISDTAPVLTDVLNTDPTLDKLYTTVGLDYGQIDLENGDRVRLFGTPGQERFDFMWKILANEALGIVILIDNSRARPLADLERYLVAFQSAIGVTPFVIGVGRTESHASPTIDDFSEYMASLDITLPVLPVDVRNKQDVVMLIQLILAQVEADLH